MGKRFASLNHCLAFARLWKVKFWRSFIKCQYFNDGWTDFHKNIYLYIFILGFFWKSEKLGSHTGSKWWPGNPDVKDNPNDPLTRWPNDPVPCLEHTINDKSQLRTHHHRPITAQNTPPPTNHSSEHTTSNQSQLCLWPYAFINDKATIWNQFRNCTSNLETGLEFTEFRLRFRNSEIKGQELTQSLLITVSTQSSQVK